MIEPTSAQERLSEAVRITAPGTALRNALDMILAARLGALICIGDTDNVIASGSDGFPLDVKFTAMRVFELSKMDGAIVVDEGMNRILRANFHLNPDSSLPTTETGMRHRTAARMSLLTDAIVVSVSERRSQICVYAKGRSMELKDASELSHDVNQLVVALQASRTSLDGVLERFTRLEFEDYVTLRDMTRAFGAFELVRQASLQLAELIPQLGSADKIVRHQLEQLSGGVDDEYLLAIRDYAANSSSNEARRIRGVFDELSPLEMSSPSRIAHILGYDDLSEDSVVTSLGLRALSHLSTVVVETAERIANEYGSLPALVDGVLRSPDRLREAGVSNPAIFIDGLLRLSGRKG